MKKKKLVIIIIAALIVVGVIVWLILKKKKTTTVTTSATLKSGLPEDMGPITTKQQIVTTTPVLQTSAGKFTKVIKDGSKGMAILRHEPANIPLAVNNKITIPSGLYAGTWNIWYIYDGSRSGEPNVKNLYIDTPFKGDASGTFTKA